MDASKLKSCYLSCSSFFLFRVKQDKPMKNILFILCTLIVLSSCSRTETEYYPDGSKMYEAHKKWGKKNGTETRWYRNNRMQSQFTYKNDVLNGEALRWFFNGNLKSKDYYTDGLLNGVTIEYDETGPKILEKEYKNDTLNGIYREWHFNGQIKTEGQTAMGLFEGKWTYYNAAGLVVGEALFDKGTGVLKGYNPKGILVRETSYQKNLKHGEEKIYNDSGKLIKILIFRNDSLTGMEVLPQK